MFYPITSPSCPMYVYIYIRSRGYWIFILGSDMVMTYCSDFGHIWQCFNLNLFLFFLTNFPVICFNVAYIYMYIRMLHNCFFREPFISQETRVINDMLSTQLWNIVTKVTKDYHMPYWLVVWNMFYFSIYWECHHPN